ncbi:hypothetical protein HG537_0C06600 [Torulaspora globosa]|uniref:Uncharacterized protein n=1 Tax=Torulaspora globosa TaxID=48254 RepID=A0A7H9HRU8_9SACH|nr:hypothetical protein HG537_0C06600 [Torulaspora sp. CBS 2947]
MRDGQEVPLYMFIVAIFLEMADIPELALFRSEVIVLTDEDEEMTEDEDV